LLSSDVYSESLFLALTVAAFYYARTNRWLLACILAPLATLTRSQGMILALPLLIEYLHERNFRLQKIRWNITAFALVPTARLAFALFLKLKFGRDKLDFGFLLVPLGAAIAGLTRLRISYNAYIWTSVGFFSCWGMLGSIPRLDLVIFPLFIFLALIGARSRAFHLGYVVASSMLAVLFMVIYSQWNWVA
jgi:hypothetical protein